MTHYINLSPGPRPYGGMRTLCGKHESIERRIAFQFVPRGRPVTCVLCQRAQKKEA